MSTPLSRLSVLAVALVSLTSGVVFGQSSEPGKPCAADIQKLCPGMKPGHGTILACLEGKQDQVSPACKDMVKAKLDALYTACSADVQKFCSSVEKGNGQVLQCLKTNKASLSDSCKSQWVKTKPAMPPPAN